MNTRENIFPILCKILTSGLKVGKKLYRLESYNGWIEIEGVKGGETYISLYLYLIMIAMCMIEWKAW